MRKLIKSFPIVLLATVFTASFSLSVTAQEAASTRTAHYSVTDTLVGKLLDDPAAAEILRRLIPTVYANEMFQSAGRDLTLKAIQQYEPEALSDANLAKIQAEFDKIPAKE